MKRRSNKSIEMRSKQRSTLNLLTKLLRLLINLKRLINKAKDLIEKREREKLINIELEAIRRREREEEAKRLTRQKEYERVKAAEEKEKEQLKAAYLLAKREEIRELRKTVKLHSKLYKEKIKEEIQTLKKYKKLNPNNISIDPDPSVPDRVMITHTSLQNKRLLAIENNKAKRRISPSGAYGRVKIDEERGS